MEKDLDALKLALTRVRVVGVDTETTCLDPLLGEVRLIQLAAGDDVFMVDIRSVKGLYSSVVTLIKKLMGNIYIIKVLHNAKFDIKWMMHHLGIDQFESIFDTMIASQLLAGGDIRMHHSLLNVVRVYNNLRLDKTEQRSDWSGELSKSQLKYAADDARALPPLHARMVKHLLMDDLLRVAKLEFDIIPILARLELTGFRLDTKAWSKLLAAKIIKRDALRVELTGMILSGVDWTTKNEDRPRRPTKPAKPSHPVRSAVGRLSASMVGLKTAMKQYDADFAKFRNAEIRHENLMTTWNQIPADVSGVINLGSHTQVKKALSNITGLDFVKLTTNDAVLQQYAGRYPVVALLREYRGADKSVTGYGESWLRAARIGGDDRIRADFRQIGAETGRMSSADPVNLQNPPADHSPNERTGKCPGCHRCCFKVVRGRRLVIADYSQIELRIAADFSGDDKMIEAFVNGMDLHIQTASLLFSVKPDDVTKTQRGFAKICNFGCVYGIGPTRFAAQTGLSFNEAKNMLWNYFLLYSGLAAWLQSAATQATDKRFTRTASGRLIRFTVEEDAGDYRETRKALSMIGRNGKNGPIQGTSADITKRAAKLVYDQLRGTSGKLVNIIHDELVVECDTRDVKMVSSIIQTEMIRAGEEFIKSVPVVVDVASSERWNK